MKMNAIEKWYEVIKSDNPDKYDEVLLRIAFFILRWFTRHKEEER